jgi:hypothetical protein
VIRHSAVEVYASLEDQRPDRIELDREPGTGIRIAAKSARGRRPAVRQTDEVYGKPRGLTYTVVSPRGFASRLTRHVSRRESHRAGEKMSNVSPTFAVANSPLSVP